ncbi:MAG: hypothetical protein RLZZ535_1805 [Cyanobacteriota bacterium]
MVTTVALYKLYGMMRNAIAKLLVDFAKERAIALPDRRSLRSQPLRSTVADLLRLKQLRSPLDDKMKKPVDRR